MQLDPGSVAGSGASHRWHFVRFMENDAYPHIGALPIASLIGAQLLTVNKAESAASMA